MTTLDGSFFTALPVPRPMARTGACFKNYSFNAPFSTVADPANKEPKSPFEELYPYQDMSPFLLGFTKSQFKKIYRFDRPQFRGSSENAGRTNRC